MKRIISALLLTVYIVTNFTFNVSATGVANSGETNGATDVELYTKNLFPEEFYDCDSETPDIGSTYTEELTTGDDAYDGAYYTLKGRRGPLFATTITKDIQGLDVKVSMMLKVDQDVIDSDRGGAKPVTFAYKVTYTDANGDEDSIDGTLATNGNNTSATWKNFNVTFTMPTIPEGATYVSTKFSAGVGGATAIYGIANNNVCAYIDCISAYAIPRENECTTKVVLTTPVDENEDGKIESVIVEVDTECVNLAGASKMEVICDSEEPLTLGTDYTIENGETAKKFVIKLDEPKLIKDFVVSKIEDIWGRTITCDSEKSSIHIYREETIVSGIYEHKSADGNFTNKIDINLNTAYVDDAGISSAIVTCNGQTLDKPDDFTIELADGESGNKKIVVTFTQPQMIETFSLSGVKDFWKRNVDTTSATIKNYNIITYTKNMLGDSFTNCDTAADVAATIDEDGSGYTRNVDTETFYSGTGSIKLDGDSGTKPNVLWGSINMTSDDAPDKVMVSAFIKKSEDLILTWSGKHPASGRDVTGENADTSPTFTQVRVYVDAKYVLPGSTSEVNVGVAKQLIGIDSANNDWQYVGKTLSLDYSQIPQNATLKRLIFFIRLDNGRTYTAIQQGNVWIDEVKMLRVPEDEEYLVTYKEVVPTDGSTDAKADKVTFKYDGPLSPVSKAVVSIKENNEDVNMPSDIEISYDKGTDVSSVSITPVSGFANGQSYSVSLSGLTDVWGRTVSGTESVNFKVIDEFIIRTENAPSAEGAKMKVINNSTTAKQAVLVSAIVNGNDIKEYKISDVATISENGGEQSLDASFDEAYPSQAGDVPIAFLWDSKNAHRPLTGIISNSTSDLVANTGNVTPVEDTVKPEFTYNENGGNDVHGEVIVEGNLNGISKGQNISLVVYKKAAGIEEGLKWYDVQPAGEDGLYRFSCVLEGDAEETEYVFAVAAFGHNGEENVFKYCSKEGVSNIISILTTKEAVEDAIKNNNTLLTVDTSDYESFAPEKQAEISTAIANDILSKVNAGGKPTVNDFKKLFNKYCALEMLRIAKAELKVQMESVVSTAMWSYFTTLDESVQDDILEDIVKAEATEDKEKQMFCDSVLSITANAITEDEKMLELLSSTTDVTGISFTGYDYLEDEEKAAVITNLNGKDNYVSCEDIKEFFDAEVQVFVDKKTGIKVTEIVNNTDADGKTDRVEVILNTVYVNDSGLSEATLTRNGLHLSVGDDFTAIVVETEDGNKKIVVTFTEPQIIETFALSGVKDLWGRNIDTTLAVIKNYTINTYTRNMLGDAFTNCDTEADVAATINTTGYTRTIDTTTAYSGTGSIKIEGKSGAAPDVAWGSVDMTKDDAPEKVMLSAFIKKSEDIIMTFSGNHPASGKPVTGENADTTPTFTQVRFYVDAKYVLPGSNDEIDAEFETSAIVDIDTENNDWQYVSAVLEPKYSKIPSNATMTKLVYYIRLDKGRGSTAIEQGNVWIDEVKMLRVPASGEYPVEYIGAEPTDGSTNAIVNKVAFNFSGAVEVESLNKGIVLINDIEADVIASDSYDSTTNVTKVTIVPVLGFENSENYKVSITGIKDVWGRDIQGTFTTSFTTIKKYDVSSEFVKVSEGIEEVLTQTKDGDIKAKFSIKNNTSKNMNVILVLAECTGDTISRFVLSPQYRDIATGATQALEATLTGFTAGEDKCIKAFLWNDADEHLIMSQLEVLE